jgi:hypothetical protein
VVSTTKQRKQLEEVNLADDSDDSASKCATVAGLDWGDKCKDGTIDAASIDGKAKEVYAESSFITEKH